MKNIEFWQLYGLKTTKFIHTFLWQISKQIRFDDGLHQSLHEKYLNSAQKEALYGTLPSDTRQSIWPVQLLWNA